MKLPAERLKGQAKFMLFAPLFFIFFLEGCNVLAPSPSAATSLFENPPEPFGIISVSKNEGSLLVTWSSSPGATSYLLYRMNGSASSSGDSTGSSLDKFTLVSMNAVSPYIDASVVIGQTYTYLVVAVGRGGTTYSSDGQNPQGGGVVTGTGTNTAASGAGPNLLTLSPASSFVNSIPGSIVATFDSSIQLPAATAFTIGGNCTLAPTISSIVLSSGNTIATAFLSGGSCSNAQLLTISLDPTKILGTDNLAGAGSAVSLTYTIDTSGPTATLGPPSSTDINSSGTSTIALTYSPSAAGGTALTGTLTAGGGGVTLTAATGNPSCTVTVSSITTAGATIELSSCTGNGTLTLHVNAGTAKDNLNNPSLVSPESALITVDNSGPTLSSLSPATSYVKVIPASISVVFSEAVDALSSANFSLSGTCTTYPSKGGVTMSAGNTTATLALSGGSCADTQALIVSVDPTAVTDLLGNAGTGAVVERTYTIDTTGPGALLGAPSSTDVNSSGISTIALTYTPSPDGGTVLTGTLTASGGGVTITTLTGNPSCSVAVSSISTSGASIALSNCSGNGTLTVHVDAATAQDSLGNNSTVSPESSVVTIDNTSPTLVSLSPSSNYVAVVPTSVVAVFSEAMTALSPSDFVLGGNCTITPAAGSVSMSSGNTTATLSLSGGTCANGQQLNVSMNPSSETDLAGNSGTGATVTNTYSIDTAGPTATLAAASSTDINSSGTSTIALTYTPSAAGGTTLTGTLTAAGGGVTITTVTGNPVCTVSVSSITTTGATITLSSCTGNGSITVHVNAGTAEDSLNNLSSVSNESDVITVDNTAPSFSSSSPSNGSAFDSIPSSIILTFSEGVNIATGDLSLGSGTCTTAPSVTSLSGSGTASVTVNLSGGACSQNQTIILSISMGSVTDLAGNSGSGTSTVTLTYAGSLEGYTVASGSGSSVSYSGAGTWVLDFAGAGVSSSSYFYQVMSANFTTNISITYNFANGGANQNKRLSYYLGSSAPSINTSNSNPQNNGWTALNGATSLSVSVSTGDYFGFAYGGSGGVNNSSEATVTNVPDGDGVVPVWQSLTPFMPNLHNEVSELGRIFHHSLLNHLTSHSDTIRGQGDQSFSAHGK